MVDARESFVYINPTMIQSIANSNVSRDAYDLPVTYIDLGGDDYYNIAEYLEDVVQKVNEALNS